MAREGARERLRLIEATGAARNMVTARDLQGLDLTRVPQELAAQLPGRDTPWLRGTCLPQVDTPEGRQALGFGTLAELRAQLPATQGLVPINSARTLWVVTVG
jgi:hypothetical protein